MATVLELEKQLREAMGSRREPITINSYCSMMRKLCQDTKMILPDRPALLKVFDRMIDGKYSQNTILGYFDKYRSIYRYLGQPYPLTINDMPKGRIQIENDVFIPLDDLEALIGFARVEGSPTERCLLAVSSVYGLRRVELSFLGASSFVPGRMRVETAKHGVRRSHYVPEFLWKWIEPGVKSLPLGSINTYSSAWRALNARMGRPYIKYEGWHSVRRTLTTSLVRSGHSQLEIEHFMRWTPNAGNMVTRYNKPGTPEESDGRIFEKHDILRMWE